MKSNGVKFPFKVKFGARFFVTLPHSSDSPLSTR
jgi:hypothetical protein